MKELLTAATLLCLMEVSAMADITASFETDAVGATPEGWTVTNTGKGEPKWTVEADQTAPSKSKVLKQSGGPLTRCCSRMTPISRTASSK